MKKYITQLNARRVFMSRMVLSMLYVIVLSYTNSDAQYRPIVFEGFTPDWQLLHYDSTLKVGGNPENGEMFFPEHASGYATGRTLVIREDTIYHLMPCIVDKDSFFSFLDIYHAQTGELIDRKIFNRSHTDRAFVPQALYFDEDGDVNVVGYRDVHKYKGGFPLLHVGSEWHMVRLKYADDSTYLYGPTPGDTNSYKVVWPFGFSHMLPLDDSTLLDISMWPSYKIRGINIFFTQVNLEGEVVYKSDTMEVLWDLPVGLLDYGQGIKRVQGLDVDEVMLYVVATNLDLNQTFSWTGRFDLHGHLLSSFRLDSVFNLQRNREDYLRGYFQQLASGGYIYGYDIMTDTGVIQITNTYDAESQLIEEFITPPKWPDHENELTYTSSKNSRSIRIPNPDGRGVTVANSLQDDQNNTQIFIGRSDGYGNRKDGLTLINSNSYPSLLMNELYYIDEDHLLLTFHTRRWGRALHSICIPISAFSAVADKESPVELSVQAYPNPTTDLLYIESDRQDIAGVMIYDATGRQVMQVSEDQWSTGVVSTRHLTPGLYYLSIQYRQGSILSKPFMRQ